MTGQIQYTNLELFFLCLGIIISGTVRCVILPIIVSSYTSIIFLIINTTFQITIITGLIFAVSKYFIKASSDIEWKLYYPMILAGIFSGIAVLCLYYSSNPIRTPVMIQSVFLGLMIIPSVIFTKIFLNKTTNYNYFYSSVSISLLLISIFITILPLITNDSNNNHINNEINNSNNNSNNNSDNNSDSQSNNYVFGWIVLYLLGIILIALHSVFQEKYLMITDNSLINQFRLLFFMSGIQFIMSVMFCWIELFLGYHSDYKEVFISIYDSFTIFINEFKTTFLVELFIFSHVIMILLMIKLNSISTNYNMILVNLVNQAMALFFLIFPQFNNGIHYPYIVVLLSLMFSMSSVILWIYGESRNSAINTSFYDNMLSYQSYNTFLRNK